MLSGFDRYLSKKNAIFGEINFSILYFRRNIQEVISMSRKCEITGLKSLRGKQRSHAMNSSIKFQQVNLHKKKYWIPDENRWIVLNVSANANRTINKKGIKAILKKIGR
jgi:large subunit ribosomal protein L28